MKKKKLTVIVREVSSPVPPVYPHPLIYTIKVAEDVFAGGAAEVAEAYEREPEIRRAVAIQRASELTENSAFAESIVDQVEEGLELIMAFEGEPDIVADWRD